MTMMKPEHETLLQLNKIKNLPPLPEVSVKIIQLVNDPDVAVKQMVEVLSLSPSLVARILGLANSAYFGCAGTIFDLRTAIIRLGLNLVKSLSLSIALNVQLDARKCPAFDVDYYWHHSLVCAVLAQKISAKTRFTGDAITQSTVYTSALLLNIGMLLLAFLIPERLQEILVQYEDSGDSLHDEIRRSLGASHYQFGYHLLHQWGLPQLYQNVLRNFESSSAQKDEMQLISLQQLSQSIAGLILDEVQIEIADFQSTAEQLGLSVEQLSSAVQFVADSKNQIKELAAIICT